MADQNIQKCLARLFIFYCCLSSVKCKIYTSFQDKTTPYTVSLSKLHDSNALGESFHDRFRRSVDFRDSHDPPGTDAGSGEKSPLQTSLVKLPDEHHNEAIVHWSGNKSNVIFVLTREHISNGAVPDSALWRSKDYGTTFQRVNMTENALIYYYYTSNVNHSKLIFADIKNRQLFLTFDEGAHVVLSSVNFMPNQILLHPFLDDWALAYDLAASTLYSSSNFGVSWDLLQKDVTPKFHWAEKGQDEDPRTVHMELQYFSETHYHSCIAPNCGKSKEDLQIGPIVPSSLIVQNEYIFVQMYDSFSSKLYVSYRRGPFKEAFFPPKLQPQNFNILNTDESQVFVAVHDREETVSLYLSDPTGRFYVLTLENIVAVTSKNSFEVDLYQVKGIKGIYIANQEIHERRDQRTFISFNKGGTWSLITPPADTIAQCTQKNNCFLHLYLEQMNFFYKVPRILSEPNAPGLIVSHGTVGSSLSYRDVGVFISNDGGQTWRKSLFEGLYELNVLDQGSVITAVNATSETRDVFFSFDEGKTWQKHSFADQNIFVDGVLNEPGITTLIISVFGHKQQAKGWIMVKANFSTILKRQCTAQDYESWIPMNQKSKNKCILGRKFTFERRKQDSICYNGQDYERPVNVTTCACTADDFECDFGFNLTDPVNRICSVAKWFHEDRPMFDCPETHFYNKSMGYRKVAADRCIGGVEINVKYQSKLVKCPVLAPEGLKLREEKPVVATNSSVNFYLTQEKGSVLNTSYTYDFGNGHVVFLIGLNASAHQVHTYTNYGTYSVKVIAENESGSATSSTVVYVEDEIVMLCVEPLYGAQIKKLTTFNTTVRGWNAINSSIGNVHFVWNFGDETHRLPMLTWDRNVSHIYEQPGSYKATVEAINSVSSLYKEISIKVYTHLKTIHFTFSTNADTFRTNDDEWVVWFRQHLQRKLAEFLQISVDQLIVVVYGKVPASADVMIVPQDPKEASDLKTDELVKKLLDSVKHHEIAFLFFKKVIQITHATLKEDQVTAKPKKNLLAILIAAPILGASLTVIILVFLYYKRKFQHVKRYSFIQSRDAADSLLEEDDDDPPLDPNPDFSHIEMTADQGENLEGENSALDSVLVMTAGASTERPVRC